MACEEADVAAFAVRPGMVDTDMQKDLRETHVAGMTEQERAKFQNLDALLKPEQPGNIMAKMVVDPDKSQNGQYIR